MRLGHIFLSRTGRTKIRQPAMHAVVDYRLLRSSRSSSPALTRLYSPKWSCMHRDRPQADSYRVNSEVRTPTCCVLCCEWH